ncbi:Predicted protease with the C-terminal PDZ domain [Porphyromonas crevioricanis]|uniref:Predicted protease with the C-terminal PDZ domain n=1 Tax=Porphyromonas crevioricanis TaxID=393921 RepID=A0A2X4PYI1_9PORP|nr:PDZ domain-containing protein [Porphyromonas crevioricanis]GAD06428.1 PDZ domain protein [Porphyromonas crevioricanis JCM 13913]SQH73409.1 Predicted protease with the C-terminal PDZ domain [Porphyromonas crevioricanis]
MKRNSLYFSLALLLFIAGQFPSQAQKNADRYCRVGMSYEISSSNNWGKGKPVLIGVQPGTPAAEAGLRAGDIIEKINGIPSSQMNAEQIDAVLRKSADNILLEVSNYKYRGRQMPMGRDCYSRNEFSEADMAQAFAHYSLEDESERRLVYPFAYTVDSLFSFEHFKTFAFAVSQNKATAEVDKAIYELVAQSFYAKGLREDSSQPDIVVDCFYALAVNRSYDANYAKEIPQRTWRYEPALKDMVQKPFLPVGAPREAAEHTLSFGLRLLDGKNTNHLLWQCRAEEYLSDPMSIFDYAQLSIPMMLMQFPFVRYYKKPIYTIARHRFLYTGVRYRADMPSEVFSVDFNSPAAKAGILAHDRIIAINGQELGAKSATQHSSEYKDFLSHTLHYRDVATSFTDSRGIEHCRYWHKEHYDKLAKIFSGKKFNTPFAYLFFFRPYINSEQMSSIVFEVANEFGRRAVIVSPSPIDNSYVSLY